MQLQDIKEVVKALDAGVGILTQVGFVLTSVLLLALLEKRDFVLALRNPLSSAVRRRLAVAGFPAASAALTLSIVLSQVDPTGHLSLVHLGAVIAGALLWSGFLFLRMKSRRWEIYQIPVLAAPFLATLVQFLPEPDLLSFCAFVVALPAFGSLILYVIEHDTAAGVSKKSVSTLFAVVPIGLAALYAILCANPLNWSVQTIAMHWGIYINAALRLQIHLRPFYDFPMQYGLGPSTAAWAACSLASTCWNGMYDLLFVLYPVYTWLMYRAYRGAFPGADAALRTVFLLLAFAGVFVWNSAGPFGAMSIPSTGPLRFLPVLLTLVLLQGQNVRTAYAVFIAGVWWSPDALVMCGMVLGAYECARRNIVQAIARCGGAAIFSFIVGSFLIWMIWGKAPDPLAYVEYILHVPGWVAPKFYGAVWIYFIVLALVIVVAASGGPDERPRNAAIAATSLATMLYYLSRSLDENIDNLMPFIVLLALRTAWLQRDRVEWRVCSSAFLGLILAGAVFLQAPSPRMFRPDFDFAAMFASERNSESEILSGIDRSRFGVVLLPISGVAPLLAIPRWGIVNAWAEWIPLPIERQRIYVQRSSDRMPDRRPEACFIAPNAQWAAQFVDAYSGKYDIVSMHVRDGYLRQGLALKGEHLSGVPNDPCGAAK
jgi:hypothetical protein